MVCRFCVVIITTLICAPTAIGASEKKCGSDSDLFDSEIKVTCYKDYSSYSSDEGNYVLTMYKVTPRDQWKNPLYRDHGDRESEFPQLKKWKEQVVDLGWDYGHLSNEKIGSSDIAARFLMPNRVPMPPAMNRAGGNWHYLERYEIEMAKKLGEITVVAGFSYDKRSEAFYFFKTYINHDKEVTASFLFSSESVHSTPTSSITSIECIEKAIGKRVFSADDNFVSEVRNDKAFSLQTWTGGEHVEHSCEAPGGDASHAS